MRASRRFCFNYDAPRREFVDIRIGCNVNARRENHEGGTKRESVYGSDDANCNVVDAASLVVVVDVRRRSACSHCHHNLAVLGPLFVIQFFRWIFIADNGSARRFISRANYTGERTS